MYKTIMGLLLIAGIGCNSPEKTVRDFIPGTYAKYSESEFSKAWDTLRIKAYDNVGNTYVVERQVGFHRIREGKLQPKEFKTERIMTVFDPSTGQLQDLKSGQLYVFSPSAKTVLAGSSEYKRVD